MITQHYYAPSSRGKTFCGMDTHGSVPWNELYATGEHGYVVLKAAVDRNCEKCNKVIEAGRDFAVVYLKEEELL